MKYFDRPEVSNSDFTSLARAYNCLPDNRAELEDIFNFGSLVDAMLTEKWRVNFFSMTLDDDGKVLQYAPDIFAQAVRLADACKKDPVISLALKHMVGQYVFIRKGFAFEYEGESYRIDARCKFDGFSRALDMGMEYKTTSCANKKQFREAIDHFHWDRAGAWYMDLARINRHWICGVSKKSGEIFKLAIDRESDIYKIGKRKYSFWAYRWDLLVTPFAKCLQKAA